MPRERSGAGNPQARCEALESWPGSRATRPCELELEQPRLQLGGRACRCARRARRGRPDRSRARRAAGPRLRRSSRGGARPPATAVRAAQFLEDVLRRVSTSLAPCLISAWQPRDCGEWIEPGIAKTSRPCLDRQPRRDQRARLQRRLDDQRAAREAGDDAVAAREVLRQRRRAERELADDEAVRPRCGARARDAASDRRDRGRCRRRRSSHAGALERAFVRRAVDAEREARDDRQPGAAQVRARTRARSRRPCGVALRLPTIGDRRALQQLDAART